MLELGSEDVGVATFDAEHREKPLQPAHPLLRMGAGSAQVVVVLLPLEPLPQLDEDVEIVGWSPAPQADCVPEGGRRRRTVVDERVVEIEEDEFDPRPAGRSVTRPG